MLHEFVATHREEIIRRCRAKVARRSIPPPTVAEINHGVPLFLDQLVHALKAGGVSTPEIGTAAMLHGHDLRLRGFTISQVVHDYGDVCQSITELAVEIEAPISADDFRTLNACLDDAIAVAVTQFSGERDQVTADGAAMRGNERLGFLAHELRNLINSSLLAFHALNSGKVGIGGSTAAVLLRGLVASEELISRSLAEVRLSHRIQQRDVFEASALTAQLTPAAVLLAADHNVTLVVPPVEDGIAIEADRLVLAAVVTNLLQNAFKFTRPATTVTLRVSASAERVLIEVQDECGGLPGEELDELFRPFEQRGANRTGVGLGLAFSRWGVEANRGRIYARNLPGAGCVFTIDLPRVTAPRSALMTA